MTGGIQLIVVVRIFDRDRALDLILRSSHVKSFLRKNVLRSGSRALRTLVETRSEAGYVRQLWYGSLGFEKYLEEIVVKGAANRCRDCPRGQHLTLRFQAGKCLLLRLSPMMARKSPSCSA